ncbi:methionyl-tRNA formyltransferase, partial [bacterium]|nr:methionyl-tRNA formyltransferase [bacterium]
MRIVFMGTPETAVPSLYRLVQAGIIPAAAVTQPDRPKGRGLKPVSPPVKQAAGDLGIPVMQPEDLRDPGFLSALQSCKADCFAVVAYRILPESVLSLPPLGCINLHFSLLPKYRGAAPVQWALLNGETHTGVTTFFIKRAVDTGDIILQKEVAIQPEDDYGSLLGRLASEGADLLVRTLENLKKGTIRRIPQTGPSSPAPKISPEQGLIDWGRNAADIANQIRAFSPSPGAYTLWRNKRLKIFRARAEEHGGTAADPGAVL